MTPANPICVALDTSDLAKARSLAKQLAQSVGCIKIGMEFFYSHGAKGYEAVASQGLPVFLDLKLHDIPNTVAQALKTLMQLSPRPAIVNLHASGGLEMMRAAANAVSGRAKLIAVTILTSLSNDDIWAAGFNPALATADHAKSLAVLAQQAGLDGVVCSTSDLAGIRAACGPGFLTVVPGIRPITTPSNDQKRIATPGAALASGADLLVIGRAITGATNPAAAVAEILQELAHGRR